MCLTTSKGTWPRAMELNVTKLAKDELIMSLLLDGSCNNLLDMQQGEVVLCCMMFFKGEAS